MYWRGQKSNAVVAVNRINQDVRLPILIREVTRLGKYHRFPRLPVSTWLRRHDECLGCIVCGSHPEFHLLETLQLVFGVLGDEVSSKYVIDKLAQPVGIGQVRSYGVATVTVVRPFLDRASTSGRGTHTSLEIGHTVIGNLRNKHTFPEYAFLHLHLSVLVDVTSGNAGEELAELDSLGRMENVIYCQTAANLQGILCTVIPGLAESFLRNLFQYPQSGHDRIVSSRPPVPAFQNIK